MLLLYSDTLPHTGPIKRARQLRHVVIKCVTLNLYNNNNTKTCLSETELNYSSVSAIFSELSPNLRCQVLHFLKGNSGVLTEKYLTVGGPKASRTCRTGPRFKKYQNPPLISYFRKHDRQIKSFTWSWFTFNSLCRLHSPTDSCIQD